MVHKASTRMTTFIFSLHFLSWDLKDDFNCLKGTLKNCTKLTFKYLEYFSCCIEIVVCTAQVITAASALKK